MNYCPRCGEPACFCDEGAKRPSVIWNGMADFPHDESLTVTAQAGEAGTAETVKQGSVHEHAVSRSEMRPNNTTIGDHR